jgi:hypothetical protein
MLREDLSMRRLIQMLALIAAAGCTPPLTVDSDYDVSTDFSKYKTWTWLPGAKPSEKDIDTLSEQRIRAAIEAELPKRGLAKAGDGADLSVTFKISVQHKIEQSSASIGIGYGWGPAHVGVSKSPTRSYDEGTLILDLVDPKTKTLVWRGTAVGTVHKDSPPEERQKNIQNAVAYLLEDYPPKK